MTFLGLFIGFLCGRAGIRATRRLSKSAKIWGLGLSTIINMKIKVHGDSKSVHGLIVSNHLSYIDILLTASIFPLRFTPKAEIAKWPFLGWFLRISKPIWVNRKARQATKKILEEFIETLKNNINLIIFPEGTTTDGKNGLLPFKSTPFEASVRVKLPVYPILLHYKENHNNIISWHGDTTFLGHVWDILGMKKIEAEVHILDPISPDSNNRKTFAEKVHKVMDAKYKKLYC